MEILGNACVGLYLSFENASFHLVFSVVPLMHSRKTFKSIHLAVLLLSALTRQNKLTAADTQHVKFYRYDLMVALGNMVKTLS